LPSRYGHLSALQGPAKAILIAGFLPLNALTWPFDIRSQWGELAHADP
jgi:hypothetical protein